MGSYSAPSEQHDRLMRAALRSVRADHYADDSDPHANAESEYASELVALAARDLTRAVDAINSDQWPIGWAKDANTKPADAATTTWTDPDGTTVYDLAHGWRDKDGDVWVCIGWFQPFEGDPIPLMSCDGDRVPLDDVIDSYGPLTMRAED